MVDPLVGACGYGVTAGALLLLAAVPGGMPMGAGSRTPALPLSARAKTGASPRGVPPSWHILPIPRYVDYGRPQDLLKLGRVAIVRRAGGPYQTTRDAAGALSGQSCVTEEELRGILKGVGVRSIESVGDDLASYAGYDTLIMLGPPSRNAQTQRAFRAMGLSFRKWRDPHTPSQPFRDWSDFGREGYLLKVGRLGRQNVAVLAGHDYDSARRRFGGAGTFYALQSFRQLLVNEGGPPRVKTAEVADAPLLAFRGCFTGFDPSEEMQWRDVRQMAAMKANANIYWYGNNLGGYNLQSASQFRYPWTPVQLALYGTYGRWCRERYITMVFCMNADHYDVAWAAPKALDGKTRDPLHYDLDHEVEPGIREMWAKLGYTVRTDVDALAAKFAQLNRAVGGGAMFQVMNEDDVFGLVHPEDKKLFRADTPDEKVNSENYGVARARFLAALYRRIRKWCPDSADMMPICPPDGVCYQTPLERNQLHSREFMGVLGATLRKEGLQDRIPILTTAGGTYAETIADEDIDRFRGWCGGAPVLLCENNFALSRVGASEIDPKGPRWPGQKSAAYPAGYRSPRLYERIWGVAWNGIGDGVRVLAWCQTQTMWNAPAANKQMVDRLATRKECSAAAYPVVDAFYSLFRRPTAYLPDDEVAPLVAVSDSIAFPAKPWEYTITYTGAMRRAAQDLRARLATLLPEVDRKWDSLAEKAAALKQPGYDAANFCAVYLARGYIRGWAEDAGPGGLLSGVALRDLYLEADAVQERYFAGPDRVPGQSVIERSFYSSSLNHLYVGRLKQPAATPAESPYFVDIWKEGLAGRFLEPVRTLALPGLADADPSLVSGWGTSDRDGSGDASRPVAAEATLRLDVPSGPTRLLVRLRVGTDTTDLTKGTGIALLVPGASHQDAVCRPRWIHWLLPQGVAAPSLTLKAEKPVRVYAVEVYRAKI